MNFYSLVVLAAAVAGVASETVMVNTPTSVVACLPVQINWTGGQAPYFLSLIPGGQPSAAALEDLGQQTGTSYTWKADLPAGTALTVQIRDSNGQLNYSDQFTIQPGSTTCASGSGKSSGTSTSASPATTGTITPSTSKNNTSGTSASTANSTSSTLKSNVSTSTSPSSTGTSGNTASTSTNSTASTQAKNDASRTSAGFVAIAVAAVVAVFA